MASGDFVLARTEYDFLGHTIDVMETSYKENANIIQLSRLRDITPFQTPLAAQYNRMTMGAALRESFSTFAPVL